MMDGVVFRKGDSCADRSGYDAGEYAGQPPELAANQERKQNKCGI
jgi:hypothetical protein